MIDLTPVVSILGRLIFTLGALMFLPAGLDLAIGNGNAAGFATAAITTTATGAATSCAMDSEARRPKRRHAARRATEFEVQAMGNSG